MGEKPENPLEGVLKNIINGITKKGALEEDVKAAWEGAVGEAAAKHSKVRSLKGGRLVVNIDDSSWLYELTLQKKEIIRKLGKSLKNSRIKDVTLRIGDIK